MSELKRIHTATILHEGWEMDNEMWVLESHNGLRSAYTTNHGSECGMTINDIDDAIKEAQDSIDGLAKAKELLLENKGG